MTTAKHAVPQSLSKSRRVVAQLAQAPRIPRRRNIEPVSQKRAAVVLRRGMRPLEFRQVEEQMEALGLISLAVLPSQRKLQITSTPVCGLIVTGSDLDASLIERAMIDEVVHHVRNAGAPVLALSDAAPLVLEALDMAQTEEPAAAGVLIHHRAQPLETCAHIERALKVIAGSPEVL